MTTTQLRPGPARLVQDQTRYAVTELWRSRVVVVMSLLIPLIWLLMIGAVAGNEVLDPATGLRVMQYATPTALTMGALYGSLPAVAVTVVEARETGLLKRLRGTPLPGWAYLAGRAGAGATFALLAVGASLAVAVLLYDVQVLWRTVPATLVTLALATVCFIVLGLAISSLAPSATAAQALAIGGAVALSFVSELFTVGVVFPRAVARVADVLPVKPVAQALQDQFDPSRSGAGWDWGALGLLLAWTVGAAVVALAGWRRPDGTVLPPRRRARPEPGHVPLEDTGSSTTLPGTPLVATEHGRPSALAMVTAQAGAVVRSTWRDPGSLLFSVGLPLGLFALVATGMDGAATVGEVPFTVHLAAGMITWGVAVTTFMNIPETVVRAREADVLKRLRGTPLTPAHLVLGRVLAGVLLAELVAVLVVVLGVTAYGMPVGTGGLALGAVLVALGAVVLTCCGFLLAAVVPTTKAFGAVSLVVLLPVAFVSDIFLVTGAPDWMATLGTVFPLKHLQNALAEVLSVTATGGTWWHAAALVGWGVVAGALAVRLFRWHRAGG